MSEEEHKCPKCGRDMEWGLIPCPSGEVGCGVAHYGYSCPLSDVEHRLESLENRLEELAQQLDSLGTCS